MPSLFMVVNEDRFFLSHRLPIALAALNKGYDVTIITKDTGHKVAIEAYGLDFIDLPINPTGMNLKEEAKTFKFLFNLYRRKKPDIVHHVGLKNILWGGLAAKLTNINGVVNAFSGLGGLFNNGDSSKTTEGVMRIIKFSNNKKRVKAIFQNDNDLGILESHKAVFPEQVYSTKGSGIDLTDYSYTPMPERDKIQVIFTGRMVKEKGVCDLIEAANILKSDYKEKVNFILCGRLTPNKSGVTEEYLNNHCDGIYINWLGERNDIKNLLQKSHIMAFPSYYREGIPKSLIEASAIGRPIVTCNSIGCKEVVRDGYNGFLVSTQSPEELAEALKKMIDNPDLREKMGKASREKAERDFSIEKVIDTHLKIYDSLLK